MVQDSTYITRGTTPTLYFGLPFDFDLMKICNVAFSQKTSLYAEDSSIVFLKTLQDCVRDVDDSRKFYVSLSEEETLLLDSHEDVEIQVKCKWVDGTVLASKIIVIDVARILDDKNIDGNTPSEDEPSEPEEELPGEELPDDELSE